eukprot:TRINITY_DN627_c0_g1_i4.p1 TRINITY_DN627_c0_g1~~TRINITY_DN627_c0_g1_i4.p1  ORF type:complete len:674 (+),score=143.01 TRINITY_DN627_c0_g1_i4:103-2124(+)
MAGIRSLSFGAIVASVLVMTTMMMGGALADIASDVLAAMNKTVNPCDDFYMYACGGWIASHPLPPSESAIFKGISSAEDADNVALLQILTNTSADVDQRLTTFYNACMDSTFINQIGNEPLLPMLEIIKTFESVEVLLLYLWTYQSWGVNAFFSFTSTIDPGNPTQVIGSMSQGGLALPDPSLYNPKNNEELLATYNKHVQKMLTYAGVTNVTAAAEQAIALETAIANFTTPISDYGTPFQLYNPLLLSDFILNQSGVLDWASYFYYVPNMNDSVKMTLDFPAYYANLSSLVANTDLAALQSYMIWQAVHAFAPYLSDEFVEENFSFFGKFLNGQQEMDPRNKTCVQATDAALGEVLGKYFVAVKFGGNSKNFALSMVEQIEAAMKADLQEIYWMDDSTRAQALVKLSQLSNQIGYPASPLNYTGLHFSKLLFNNAIEANAWMAHFQTQQIGQPANRNLWDMTPSTVNAYYDPTKNQMVFPAGILQSPYFDQSFPDAMNFGGSGVIMGHELTHGFDNQGRDYDGTGKLINWWQPATSSKFDSLAQCVASQYSKFEPLPGVFVNGNQTLPENIADMGGTKNSYNALAAKLGNATMHSPSIVPGFTNSQLFFVAYAQGWCSVFTPEYIKILVATDVHSPPQFRVLGPLINHPYFAQEFNCPVGSNMNPKNKCAIW